MKIDPLSSQIIEVSSGGIYLHNHLITPTSYTYICTRLTIRKADLIPEEQYKRLLNMDLSQISRFIGETRYQQEVNELAGHMSGIELIETALTTNMARTFRNILEISPGALQELARRYLARWDIVNVMTIMRGKQFELEKPGIREVLFPAGSLSEQKLDSLLSQREMCDVVDALSDWDLYPVLSNVCELGYRKGLFAELENSLFISYYTNLYRDAKTGIRGGNAILPYLRIEIDITNIRNMFRLRAGSREKDITSYMIPGGNIRQPEFQRIFQTEDREQFFLEMQKTNIFGLVTKALQDLRCDKNVCEADAADMIWLRWSERRTPLFAVMTAVNRVRLHQMDAMARRFPFSVLPILSYLDRKRYEVNNLRAIARGKEFGLNSDQIFQYLVL